MKLKHFDHDGRVRFVTFSTHKRIPLLTNNQFRQVIIRSFKEMRQETGIQLLGYVIMPEHIHLVIVPPIEIKLGQAIGDLKRRSAKEILNLIQNESLLRRLTIRRNGQQRRTMWQRRCFDHNCRNDYVVHNKIRYCHSNPVSRGMVISPCDYPWSSYRWYHGLKGVDLNLEKSEIAL